MRATCVRVAACAAALLAAPATATAAPPGASPVHLAAGEPVSGDAADFGDLLADPSGYYREPRRAALYTPAVWAMLRERGTTLSYHLRWRRDFGPVEPGQPRIEDALPTLRAAAEHGVPITAWLVVPFTDGYWATEGNALMWRQVVEDFRAWAADHDLEFATVLLDFEASLQDTVRLGQLRRDPGSAIRAGWTGLGPRRQCRAARTYVELIRWIQRQGLRVHVAAYPMYIDDLLNGDTALADAFGLPYLAPGVADEVGFMTMRSVYVDFTGIDPGTHLQLSYARDIQRLFGAEGQHVLGVPGVPPYHHLGNVVQDIRALAAVGHTQIGLYSLETTVDTFGEDGLRAVLDAGLEPLSPAELDRVRAPTAGTVLARTAYQAGDAALGLVTPAASWGNEGRPSRPNRWPAGCG